MNYIASADADRNRKRKWKINSLEWQVCDSSFQYYAFLWTHTVRVCCSASVRLCSASKRVCVLCVRFNQKHQASHQCNYSVCLHCTYHFWCGDDECAFYVRLATKQHKQEQHMLDVMLCVCLRACMCVCAIYCGQFFPLSLSSSHFIPCHVPFSAASEFGDTG